MDGGNLLLPAYFPDAFQRTGVKLEYGTAVDYFQVSEFTCDLFQHRAVQGIIGGFIAAAVQMVITEGAFSVYTALSAEKDDFPLSFCQNFVVSVHKYVL